MGRETSGHNERYRLQIFLLLFYGKYQTGFRVPVDKKSISVKYKQEQRSLIYVILNYCLVHGNVIKYRLIMLPGILARLHMILLYGYNKFVTMEYHTNGIKAVDIYTPHHFRRIIFHYVVYTYILCCVA